MNEFRILLIDDDEDQEKQLKEAIDNFNKIYIINKLTDTGIITDEKLILKLERLDNKEEIYTMLKKQGKINPVIEDIFKFSIVYEVVKTAKDAILLLYKENFHGLIMDLELEIEDKQREEEEYSGNILLNQIIEKEIIPIVVRTGFPSKISRKINQSIISVFSKDKPLYDILDMLFKTYNDSVFKIFGSRGEISKNIKELFWDIIPKCLPNVNPEISSLNSETKEAVIIRYISSWLNNKYMFDEEYIDVNPIEMYMFPNPIQQVCTCDLYEKKSENQNYSDYYIVLTPACDLANKKTDEVILCKIKPYDEIKNFKDQLDKYYKQVKDSKKDESKKKLEKWFRNAGSDSVRYHFLPKAMNFAGGFVDFRSIIVLDYDKNNGLIKDGNYTKIGVITESFKRDIIARFSSYYHRQGQPKFNSESVLNNLK